MKKFFLLALSLFYATFMSAQLSGTYTINSNASQNPDYTSFGAAVSALSAGVSGQVVFQVAPGTYEEYVNIGIVSGASETNRVIFRGMGGSNLDVTVTSNAGYTDNSTVKLTGTGHVSFENMTLATTSANKAKVVILTNGTTGLRFDGVRFVGRVSTGNNDGDANIVYMASGDWADANNEFTNCEFVNGFIALYYQGHNIYQYNDGLLIENCTFTNQSSKSIYVTFTDHVTLRGNLINSDYDVKSDYNAIDIYRCRYDCLFENNVMNVTRTSNYTNVFRMRPVVGTATQPVIIRNNIVNLHCNVNSSYCCDFDYDDSDYIYFVNNTLRCTGTGNVGSLFVEDDWSHLYVYNNLIVNETSGYVFRFQSNSTERFCDYNRISFTGSNFARMGSTDYATMGNWTTATGFDSHSALCTPQFVGADDLHITSSNGITVANPLSYVPKDIDDQNRSATAPCAGADEYASGTNLPPVVANPVSNIVFETYPASQTVNLTNTFNDPDDPNENIVITVASNSNPTLVGTTLNNRTLQVQRLLATGGNAVIVLQAVSNGQSVQTSFTVECVAEDLPPVVANPLAPIQFNDFPQTLSFDLTNTFDDPDNNNNFIEITVQSCPSEIAANITNKQLSVSRTTPNAFNNKTLVIRATSNNKFVDMNVSVSGSEVVIVTDVADFEDVALGPQGYWQPEEGTNEMLSGGWSFTNYYSSYFWGGFTASNHTNLNQTGLDAQYTAAAGSGYDGSTQYAVAYTMGAQTEVSAIDGTSQTVTGCYVTNNLWAYQNMLEGDYTATPFGGTSGNDPDWFKLTATGKNANGQTVGTLDFYLADYRFSNNDEDYILNTWEWFDLSPLGEVATISFSLSSSKSNSYGMITPAYFCMDDFNGGVAVDQPPYIANPVSDVVINDFPQTINVNLDGVATDPDDPDENIVYSLVSNSNTNALAATMNGKTLILTRQNHNAASANLVMRATSDGQSVDFNIHVTINAATDLPPVIANPISDIVLEQYPQTMQVDLNGVATDPDDPDENISYMVISNSNTAALVAQVSIKTLNLVRLTGEEATADITVRATSNGQHVDFNIHVIMVRVTDQSPYIINPVDDVIFTVFPESIEINLDGVATDDDDPDENIVYSLVSNSNEEAVSAELIDKILIINRLNESEATADLTMRATSNGLYVDFNIHLVILPFVGVSEHPCMVAAYPNPTQGPLTLRLGDASHFEYRVYDLIGQLVLQGQSQGNEAAIDLSPCQKGVYFIALTDGRRQMIQKVVVR